MRLSSSSLEALRAAVLSQFSDVLPAAKCDLLLQIKDDNWGGMFVDIVEGHSIPDRSVVKVVVEATQEIEAPPQVCGPKSSQCSLFSMAMLQECICILPQTFYTHRSCLKVI